MNPALLVVAFDITSIRAYGVAAGALPLDLASYTNGSFTESPFILFESVHGRNPTEFTRSWGPPYTHWQSDTSQAPLLSPFAPQAKAHDDVLNPCIVVKLSFVSSETDRGDINWHMKNSSWNEEPDPHSIKELMFWVRIEAKPIASSNVC